jgi:branched-chain amino acid transport system substrate-binding protein
MDSRAFQESRVLISHYYKLLRRGTIDERIPQQVHFKSTITLEKKMKIIYRLIAILVLVGMVAGCATTTPTPTQAPVETKPVVAPTVEAKPTEVPTEAPTAELPKEPIVIGSIQDLTGTAADAGMANAWGAEYAVKMINEQGGIDGRMLKMITVDCKNDLNEGINAYHKLVDEDKVSAIIGPPLSNPASGWVELSAEDKMPIVGHFMDDIVTTNPETGKAYPYMFLAEPGAAAQAHAIAKFALENLGLKKFATLYNTGNAFAKAQAVPFMKYVTDNGGEVVAEQTFTWSDTDYSAQALKVAQAAPDAVFLSDYVVQAAPAYDALRDAGFEGVILGANTVALPFASLVKNPVHDVYFLQNYDQLNPTSPCYDLTQTYMKETKSEYPKSNTSFGWDAVQVLAAAMRKAKDPTNGPEVRDLLEKTTDVPICAGKITIDPATHRPSNLGMFIADYDKNNQMRILTFILP